MKRRDLIKKLKKMAKEQGLQYREEEGGKHTKVYFDPSKQTVVPRHNEIHEITAAQILKHMSKGEEQ